MESAFTSVRAALCGEFNGYFRNMIETLTNSKLRRMVRELQLRGIRQDRLSNDWVVRTEPAERSR